MRLDKWAEEQIAAAQQAITDTGIQINEIKHQKYLASTLEELQEWETKQITLEKKRKRQRSQIWEIEDEINAKRDELLEKIQQQLKQNSHCEHLYVLRWYLK